MVAIHLTPDDVLPPGGPFEPEMVLIPAGEFLMGSDPKLDRDAEGNEQPQHTLALPDYYLARTPVTNAQYLAFVQATGQGAPLYWQGGKPPEGKENHPVVDVSWYDTLAYCRWLEDRLQVPGSRFQVWRDGHLETLNLKPGTFSVCLPSEAEWEKGARGPEGRIYPWGDRWEAGRSNSGKGCWRAFVEIYTGRTTPVDAYPNGVSPYGLLGMAGNVHEWTRSLYTGYPYSSDDGREDLEASGARVLRGGESTSDAKYVRCAFRFTEHPEYKRSGFRVAVVLGVPGEPWFSLPMQKVEVERAAQMDRVPVVPRASIPVEKEAALPRVLPPGEPFEPEMVLIPAGQFLMGSDPQVDKDAYDDEQPQHPLTLPDYYLARTPVTNAQYLAFVQATGHDAPEHWQGDKPPRAKEIHPVVNVSWRDTLAYCRWLAQVTGRPYSLPSEAQWEKGARGPEGRIYPWENKWDARRCNMGRYFLGLSIGGDTTPVDTYPDGASLYGLLDMAGNVHEWTRSLYISYPYRLGDVREDLEAAGARVLRGGSFINTAEGVRCASRVKVNQGWDWNFGFRVAMTPG